MNKRFTIYYLVAAYCGYTAYSLIMDIQEGAPASPLMNVITVGFFSLAASRDCHLHHHSREKGKETGKIGG